MVYEIKDTDITQSKVLIPCPCCNGYTLADISDNHGVITEIDIGYIVKFRNNQWVVESEVEHKTRIQAN